MGGAGVATPGHGPTQKPRHLLSPGIYPSTPLNAGRLMPAFRTFQDSLLMVGLQGFDANDPHRCAAFGTRRAFWFDARWIKERSPWHNSPSIP
jgi:hypothetical protein